MVAFQGQHLGTTEATEAFFAMTKLFQSKDVSHKHSSRTLYCTAMAAFILEDALSVWMNLGKLLLFV